MSADRINNSIRAEVRRAEKETDIRQLEVIRERLLQLGAWTEAEHVRVKIRELQAAWAQVN